MKSVQTWNKATALEMVKLHKEVLSYIPWWRILKRLQRQAIIEYWVGQAEKEQL